MSDDPCDGATDGPWDTANLVRAKDAEIARLRKELRALTALLAEMRHDLIWCSGSGDFAPGGVARVGWEVQR